ncbi:MAG: sigma-70 family RNA polymerase sigma factor [Acidobacteriota bacterium]
MAQGKLTQLLIEWSDGDRKALEELMPLVYDRLQGMADRYLRKERSNHTLEAPGLVNEAFLRLIDQDRVRWRDRAHFFAIASQMMRRILVDHARRHGSAKRGAAFDRVSLSDSDPIPVEKAPDLVALDDALNTLAETHPEGARVVELRYFGGLTQEEISAVMGISTATVIRRWRTTRAWLYRFLVQGETDDL